MARPVKHYSDFLNSWSALVGVPSTRVTTEIADVAESLFNTAYSGMWKQGNWSEACPMGEARFVGNRLTYANNAANATYWTATAITATANSAANPLDGNTTATKLMETAATSAHKVVQSSVNFFPSTEYTISSYVRPNGRTSVQISVSDGATTHSAFYNLSTGAVGTTSNTTTTAIAQHPNGFWLCQMTFTSATTASSSGTYTVGLSTDGATLSYAGDTAKGVYVWGNLVQQTGNIPQSDLVISWDQAGENVIDTVFDLYRTNPMATTYPSQQGFQLTPNGLQIINGTGSSYYVNGVNQQNLYGALTANPLFLYYRKSCPSFTGDVFDATDTYAVGEQMYFTNSLSQGDYYKCLVATTAGQDPDDTPASWEVLPVFETFFLHTVYQAYGDWLISDGQQDKALGIYSIAQKKMDDAFDVMERQSGKVLPMSVQTHLTTRPSSY